MSRRISEAFLLLLWCLPLIAMVGLYLDFSDSNPLVLLKPGLFDSNRTLLLVLAISAFVASLPAKPRLNPLSVTTCLFLTWVFLSSAAGGKLFDALLFSQTWLAAVLIFLCTVKLYPRNFCMKRKLGLFHGPVTGVAVLSLLPMVFNDDVIRVTGPFLLANVYSNWLLLLLPLLLQDLLLGDKRYLPVSLITCGLTLASLALTYSRACWILTLTTLGIVTLLAQSVGWKRVLAWALTLLGLAALLLSLRDQLGGPGFIACWAVATQLPAFFECAFFRRSKSPQLRCLQAMALAGLVVLMVGHSKTATDLGHNAKSRMDNLVQFDNSTKSRLEFWEAALDIANDHPILGTGPDGFSDYYPQHQKHYYYYSDSPHNSFLELASELGWVGATLFLLGLAALARRVAGQRTLSITQSFALVGFGAGLVQAQVDVTYQFAYVWITLAFVGAVLHGPAPEDPTRAKPFRPTYALALAIFPLLYVGLLQRDFESARASYDDQLLMENSLRISHALPHWSKPALKGLETGLFLSGQSEDQKARERLLDLLEPLVDRVLKSAPHNAQSYQLAGDFFYQRGRVDEARKNFEKALSLDPFNRPLIYHGLITIAASQGDREAFSRWAGAALRQYPLEQFKLAHKGHADKLRTQLAQLFFLIADTLTPYRYPKETEPLYRFILEGQKGPRGLHGLGVSLYYQGRNEEALYYLREAHRLDPLFPLPEGVKE